MTQYIAGTPLKEIPPIIVFAFDALDQIFYVQSLRIKWKMNQ